MSLAYEGNLIRPPSEAQSLILQATVGCSENSCTFCGAYNTVRFRKRNFGEFQTHTDWVCKSHGVHDADVSRIFLADGDALVLETEELDKILAYLNDRFPNLKRIGIYASAKNVLAKQPAELAEFALRKMGIAYVGLESGSDDILQKVKKPATAEEQVRAVKALNDAGIKTSVMVLLGLGGRECSRDHALESAKALNQMQPRYLSFLTVMVVPGTPLHRQMQRGEFSLPDTNELLQELRLIISMLDLKKTILRANHASNYLPIGGTMPKDKNPILQSIDMALRGEVSLRPEFFRGL